MTFRLDDIDSICGIRLILRNRICLMKSFLDLGMMQGIWLGLSTDGMDPHSNMSSTHNAWPVLLTIYNIPSWLCMKVSDDVTADIRAQTARK